jgi:hypothetical protein
MKVGRLEVGIHQGKRMRQLVGQRQGLVESCQALMGIAEYLEDVGQQRQALDGSGAGGLRVRLFMIVEGEGLLEVLSGQGTLSENV